MRVLSAGMNILGDLRSQRETLERSKSRLEDADIDLNRASRVLRSMGRRAAANKMITGGIGAAVFLALMIILFWQ
jgi:vesicle transport through interaction with t-SNAREs protein 1